ncbi:MAG: FG-GAP-like repeat-containing protein, partial [Anaerolineae bacterium]|nr:FG-GAP-like repeat-containing protein [Anaerolineae bacterium]
MALYRLFQRLVTIAVVVGVVISAGGSDIFAGDGPYDPAQAPQQTGLRLIESDDPLVQREGSWTTQTTAGASGGSYLYNTGSLNDVLTLNFIGSTFEIVYVGGPTLGMIALEVDGTVLNTPSMYAQSTTYGQRISVNYLPAGSHTLRVYGQPNSLITVDAFYAEIATAGNNPTCPSELSVPYEDIAAFRNAINLANSDPDVTTICLDGGYTFTNAATGVDALPIITTEIIIEGNGVTLTRSGINNLRFYEIATTGRLTLRDQILLSGSVTGNGGGILNNGGSLTLDNVWLHMGHANGNGAGIYSNGGSLQIGGSTFASNTAANGAGLYTTNGTSTTITHTTFAENSATQDGGALYHEGTLMVVLGGFANNSAGRYGGAIHNLGTATLNASIFDANTAATRGGAINNQGTLTLTGNSLVYHNTVTGGTASGGGVYSAMGSQLTLRYTVVTENTAANGGGVRSEGTLSVESNTEFTLNQATQQGGALYIGDGTVTITNTRLLSNTAGTNGGAIFNASTTDSLSFSDSLVQENYAATRGGGFYSAGPLAIEHSNLHSNGAGTQGGGIYLTAASNASAHNSCIVGNSTTNAVHNAGTTARSFTHNWWGAADGPSGVGPGSGDAVSNYITYTDFLSTDSPCASTLPPLPPTLSCQSWQDGFAYGWTDSSAGGPYVVWDTHGMYGNASGTGTWTVSTYYDVASLTPAADTWYFRFTDNGLGDDYEVYQGPAAPTPGTILGSLVTQNPDGFYNITEDFVQLVWSVETPLNLSASLQFFSFCSTTQPPIPNRGPIVTAGPDQVLLIPDYEAQLSGTVFDADGLPGTGTTSHWEVVSGPGTVAFEPHPTGNTAVSDAEDPTVTFSTTGVYVLRLTGSDGLLSATDDVTLVVSDDIDLTVQSLDTAAFVVDHRTLEVSGTLSAQIANLGEASTSIEFTLLFFEDVEDQNHALNGMYDPGVDRILAQSQMQALVGGASVVVTAPASGDVSFAGIPVHAFVDSTLAITETNEVNNVLSSVGVCVGTAPGPFAPPEEQLELNWTGSSTLPNSHEVIMAPVIADLNDDGIPDILFVSNSADVEQNGTLRAISGDGSGEIFATAGVEQLRSNGGIAVADIDLNDGGLPEILVTSESWGLMAFQNDGTPIPTLTLTNGSYPAIANIDEDANNTPEIIVGNYVYRNDGSLFWTGDFGAQSSLSVVADLDMSGTPEILSGSIAYHADGSLYWHNTTLDSSDGWSNFTAIANLDADAFPEIVFVSYNEGNLYILEHDGTTKWGPINIPSFNGGPPIIADVDGDGEPEIGVASSTNYTVYETVSEANGIVTAFSPVERWVANTDDHNSTLTSATAFDFNGDGADEIVYGDQYSLRIFDGSSGTVLWSIASPNATSFEYPVVADVNGDGDAEIVKVTTGEYTGGVQVYGNPAWSYTRPVWNQHTYHITNINDDGSIPRYEANNWTTYNNYHENPVFSTCENPRRDVTVSGIHRDINNRQILSARVGNAGNVVTPANIGVGFYNGDPENGGTLITTLSLTNALNPGEYEALTWTVPAGTDALPLWVWVDNGEVFAEGPAQGSTNPYEENNIDNTGLYFTATPNTAPAVDAGPASVTILPGEVLNLNGTATDTDNLPISVLEHTWTVTAAPEGGHADIADPSALVTTVQFTGRGVYELTLTATDLDLTASDTILVEVSPLPPAQTPGLIGSPANGSSLTGLVPITLLEGATITNATLEMWPAYNPNAVTTLATNLAANGGETLATLDTTRLSNDSYYIRLVGVDGTSQETHSVIMVTAVGENKPGRVKFTVTDLVVPVSGLPITIGRTYDSLERNLNGDFGYGWSLAIGNPRLEVDGHQNVTLTMPDGRRTTFYFTPQPMGLVF